MAWANGYTRTSTPEWKRTRARILARDRGTCHVCGQPGADEVDHMLAVSEGGTEDDANLAAIHGVPCHRRKTQAEAIAARLRYPRKRPPEAHPGRRAAAPPAPGL